MKKRIIAFLLTLCMMLCLVPVQLEVEADALSLSSLTCSAYISNPTARSYIDTMMRYYINNNSNLQSMLTSGKCVVFMFEGGSDNYWNGETYEKSLYDNRIQAVVFVVKADASGKAYIDFCSETCSSIASNVLNCTPGVGYSGSTTILDGVYRMYRWDHTGPYASFQLDIPNSNANGYGLYTPSSIPDGQLLGCSGINVHTRSTTSGSEWSAGCQVIGTTAYSSNEYNAFFRSVSGINGTPWVNYYSSPKQLYSYNALGGYGYGSGYTVGYYVVDRQLAMIGTNGVKYGTGSLVNVFNQTALSKLTSYSTPKAQAAGALNFEYATSQCTYYPAHCELKAKAAETVNSQPCSVSTTYNSTVVENMTTGTTYTCTGLFKNHYGNLWYRVKTASGKTGYIYSGNVTYVKDLSSDVVLTGATAPNGLVQGNAWIINGTVKSTYTGIHSVATYVQEGIPSNGTTLLSASDSISNKSYVLNGSNVDDNMWMSDLATGPHTYIIQVAYTNYHAADTTTLASTTKTLELMRKYFMVIPSSVSQSSCSHSNTEYVLQTSTCLSSGSSVTACSKCGKVTENVTSGGHSYSDWTVTQDPTCTVDGTKQRICSRCNAVDYGTVAATGHSYTAVRIPANCSDYEHTLYSCGGCDDQYIEYPEDMMSGWSTVKPEGIEESLIEQQTQYRYSDYETKTSYETSLPGYTVKSTAWIQSGTGSVEYVRNWLSNWNNVESDFPTDHALYTKYNNLSKKVTDTSATVTESDTTMTKVDSDAHTGYLWYHWYSPTLGYSRFEYYTNWNCTIFHAYYGTNAPGDYTYEPSEGSYHAGCQTCSNDMVWYIPVYTQKYTNYKKQFTYERWTDWSAWSETPATASDTRKVETRTVYRYYVGGLGDHEYDSTTTATCSTDGIKTYTCKYCDHSYTEAQSAFGHSFDEARGFCGVCGELSPEHTYYLTGTINGVTYTADTIAADPGSASFDHIRFDENGVLDIALTGAITDMGLCCFKDGVQSYTTSFANYSDQTGAGDMTFWLTYVDNINMDWCVHRWDEGKVVSTAGCTTDGVIRHTCTGTTVDGHTCTWTKDVVDLATGHDYVDGVCTSCGLTTAHEDFYLFGWINGNDYACEADYENTGIYKFVDGKLVATFQTDCYVAVKRGDNSVWYMTDGYPGDDVSSATLFDSRMTGEKSDRLFVPRGREITFTLTENADGSFTLSYVAAICEHPTHGTDGLCTLCGDAAEHTFENGACTGCGLGCVHSWSEGVCTVCQASCVHNWKDGACEICGVACVHSYSNGYCVTCGHVCAHDWADGACQICGKPCEHTYSGGACVLCGQEKPWKDYYLFGFINGANYGCEEDYANIGIYKFVDGMLTVTFESTSYVAVKAEDNTSWYMTDGYPGDGVPTAKLYKTDVYGVTPDKMYVPGGVEVTFILEDNGDDTFTLSYVVRAPEPVVMPTLDLSHPSLSFESEIVYNVYFTATDLVDVVEMGLITFESRLVDGTIDDAVDVLPNAKTSGSYYMAQTGGIAAKDMGTALYFKVYAKLRDGSYAYSAVGGYHAKAYSNSVLAGNNSTQMKALVVSMLNYGAEAQKFFGYDTDELINASLTADQQALVGDYHEAMVDAPVTVPASKVGQFALNRAGFTALNATVSFDGAFAINYYFATSMVPDGDFTMYYWTLDDYNAASVLTTGNATGSMVMEETETVNRFWAEVTDIAAKDLDTTIFVAAVYEAGGQTYATGVIAYHVGKYCESVAAGTSNAADFAAATATYGYYAKKYFASIL